MIRHLQSSILTLEEKNMISSPMRFIINLNFFVSLSHTENPKNGRYYQEDNFWAAREAVQTIDKFWSIKKLKNEYTGLKYLTVSFGWWENNIRPLMSERHYLIHIEHSPLVNILRCTLLYCHYIVKLIVYSLQIHDIYLMIYLV